MNNDPVYPENMLVIVIVQT